MSKARLPLLSPFTCWECKRVLGEMDGARLILSLASGDPIEIRQTTVIYCTAPTCGGATLWKKLKKGEPTRGPIYAPCYNDAVEV